MPMAPIGSIHRRRWSCERQETATLLPIVWMSKCNDMILVRCRYLSANYILTKTCASNAMMKHQLRRMMRRDEGSVALEFRDIGWYGAYAYRNRNITQTTSKLLHVPVVYRFALQLFMQPYSRTNKNTKKHSIQLLILLWFAEFSKSFLFHHEPSTGSCSDSTQVAIRHI